MAAINNLAGQIVKDGKIIYSEKIEEGLYFVVIMMYEPFYNGKNRQNHQNSSQLSIQAVMTTGKRQEWSSGVVSLEHAEVCEISENDKFKSLRSELKTKDGFRIWQKDYFYRGNQRQVGWFVEVPKLELLHYCKIN